MQNFIKIILFCIGLILILDGSILILLGKINLGTVAPLLLGIIFMLHAICWNQLQSILTNHSKLKKVWQGCWIAFAIWLFSFMLFILFLKQNILDDVDIQSVKVIIVLGGGIQNGQPSPALAKRLDRAASFSQMQPQALILMTGGIGYGQSRSEADIMSNYVQTQYSIKKSQILLEAKSTSTELNLKNSIPILMQHHIRLTDPIVIITSDFHTLRSHAIARKQGYQNVYMLAAETPISIRYNAWLREYFAFISGWILNEY